MTATDSEIEAIISTIFEYYGYDFSGYSRASLNRRVNRLLELGNYSHVEDLLSRIRHEPDYFERVVGDLTVNVTEMFRDPQFYKQLREKILPIIGTKPFIRIWHAGCSTGEEVFSMAILLDEHKLLEKTLLYATDISPDVLQTAKKGIFPLRQMKQYAENYASSGGKEDFSKYYMANYGLAKFEDRLIARMVFSQHNLVSDRSFNEFDLILCRNVLIYFDKDLQNRALTLFDDSLPNLGFLALGSKENIKFSVLSHRYQQVEREKIWKKLR
ncbi:CheR family methyltransferase [Flavobacterium silvaticum]|uniref:Protein-glutamate O-methyltransferase CheR n=1 Tax=Flavobacterium silvaticum TaxID=1852020 RepID=A0A972JIB2_9FLAO|nr:protein-glutamate O-methyltransferase CheR [Flavobacterium silvaticum]NMH28018.1 protein-glutamate O-methyltransferase CheR [Flavobacterium silvaticum]